MSLFKPALAAAALILATPALAEEPITFEAASGETAEAFQGAFAVPENRADPDSRMIEIGYVRFPATTDNPGPPIVYLAGGPGGSGTGTAERQRFPLFMEMRRHADVIAFDQRGTGLSDDAPRCKSSIGGDDSQRVSDADITAAYRAAVAECREFWDGAGLDIRGYTTAESVQDISALRRHLGAETVTLWGISYGSHLAFAALDAIPDEIDRVIIASAEGPDQTVKLPARTDAYFARLQAAVNTQPAAKAAYPDIADLMRRVHEKLDAAPLLIELESASGETIPFLFQRPHAQMMASGLIADPDNAVYLLQLYSALDAGSAEAVKAFMGYFFEPGEPISLNPMSTAMDLASGVSRARLAQVREQADTALLRDYLNFPMPHILGVWPDIDLGESFRDGPVGDTPVLLFSGTLDGRTYPEGQAEAVAGLTNVQAVTVVNAGHNLYMRSPEIAAAMHRFMRDEPIGVTEITVDLPDFAPE